MIFLEVMINWIMLSLLYVLMGVPMTLLWGSTKIINIAQGELLMLGAYTAFNAVCFGISLPYAFLICAVWSLMMGLSAYKGAFLKLIFKRKETEKESILFTVALSYIIVNFGLLLWGGRLRGYRIMTWQIEFAGLTLPLNRIFVILSCTTLICVLVVLIYATRFGKIIRASIDNRVEAQLCGLNPSNVYLACTLISFLFSALLGILVSIIYDISPNMGFFYVMIAFIVAIMGGLGKVKGCILAGFIIGFVQTLIGYFVSGGVALTLVYLMFILILIFKPEGIFT